MTEASNDHRPQRPIATTRGVVATSVVVVVAVLAVGVLAWWTSGPPQRPDRPLATVTVERDLEYVPGSLLDVLRPAGDGPWPTVVLVHGCCGGREDMFQLAHELAVRGTLVFNAGWLPTTSGGSYPGVYEEVACAIRFARQWAATDQGADPLTLVAWSDGALLGSVVAMSDDGRWGERCPGSAPTRPDRFVGVAGFYGLGDTDALSGAEREGAEAFLGGSPAAAPEAWASGNPYALLGVHRTVQMELVVGVEDALVEDAFCFEQALVAAGYPASLTLIADAGHLEVLSPRNAAGSVVVDVVTGSTPRPSDLVDPADLSVPACP